MVKRATHCQQDPRKIIGCFKNQQCFLGDISGVLFMSDLLDFNWALARHTVACNEAVALPAVIKVWSGDFVRCIAGSLQCQACLGVVWKVVYAMTWVGGSLVPFQAHPSLTIPTFKVLLIGPYVRWFVEVLCRQCWTCINAYVRWCEVMCRADMWGGRNKTSQPSLVSSDKLPRSWPHTSQSSLHLTMA